MTTESMGAGDEARHAPPRRAVVGLGTNLGDREATLATAFEALGDLPETTLMGRSRVRETAPVGGVSQGPFLNAAALLSTALGPRELLRHLLSIEARHGRVRRERWGPRTLDLDVLWMEGVFVDDPSLHVPHQHLRARRFALEPLIELVPDARDPRDGANLASVLATLP